MPVAHNMHLTLFAPCIASPLPCIGAAGPLGTKPSSAGFGRRLLDSLTSGRHLLERRMGRNGDRDRGWKNSGVDTWDEDTAGRHLLERGGRGGRGESGWKDSGADNWDEDTAGRHLLERRTGRSNDRDRGWKDNGADNWGNSWGRHLLERRTGRPGGNRGGGGGGWGGSSWTARDRAYSAAFRNTNAAIEAAAPGE
jgi:hypothetical protein